MLMMTATRAETMFRNPWKYLAGVLSMSILLLAAGCTEPKGERGGCAADNQCKGDRVCSSQGVCVDPSALADASGQTGGDQDAGPTADAGPSHDASTPPDAAQVDAGTQDTGESACAQAPTAVATIAADGQPSGQSIEAAPDTLIKLDGRSSTAPNGTIRKYEWSFVKFPYQADLPNQKPRLQVGQDGTASFRAKNIGTYVLELTVQDSHGTKSCAAARVTAEVNTDAQIYVEMVWTTPGDHDQTDNNGTDLDLHYKHPQGEWGYEPLDIFWYNPTADWGSRNNHDDDPKLLFDDDDGNGPESVVHDQAQPLSYRVGVYYYDDNGMGPSDVTIRVYLNGTLSREITGERMPGKDTFYEALTIDAGHMTTHLDDAHYDGYPPTN